MRTGQRALVEAALAATGLTQVALARVLGVDGSTVRRWLSGASQVSAPVARLLRLLGRRPDLVALLDDR